MSRIIMHPDVEIALLKEIDETIYAVESYDITTIRASTINRMIAKYISENTMLKFLYVVKIVMKFTFHINTFTMLLH